VAADATSTGVRPPSVVAPVAAKPAGGIATVNGIRHGYDADADIHSGAHRLTLGQLRASGGTQRTRQHSVAGKGAAERTLSERSLKEGLGLVSLQLQS
jgi:hypothetical protein